MNAETKIRKGVHAKLSQARQDFHKLELKKSGKNSFAGYDYFELGDFLVPALKVFDAVGLGATISFDRETATMTIVDLDAPDNTIVITSPMGSAALKGCHEVQNIGAVETYQRRYLWVAALEIVEHDALDKTTGKSGAKEDVPDKITDADRATIQTLADTAGRTAKAICDAYGVDNLTRLTAKQGAEAIAKLQKIIKEKEPANA